MAGKRFIDSKLFDKIWFRKLPPRYKLFWLYILGTCNRAGMWDVDEDMLQFRLRIDPPIDLKDFLKTMDGKIVEIDDGEKWYIVDYIRVQYGELKKNYNAHADVIKLVYQYKLHEQFEVLPKTWSSLHNKDKAKEKDKDVFYSSNSNNSNNSTINSTVGKKRNYKKGTIFKVPLEKEIEEYMKEIKFVDSSTMATKFFNHYEMKGWVVGRTKMKDWKAAVRYWKSHNQTSNTISEEDYKADLARRFDE